MPKYTLNTAFTQEDLTRFLASGSNVVVAKPNAGGAPNVAWLVYRPLVANTVTWEDRYGIYASNTDIVNGAQLTQMSKSEFPAVEAKTYVLSPAGFFGPPTGGGNRGSYYSQNEYDNLPKGYLTMGLFQDADVDGVAVTGNAISAAPVIYNSTAEMTPYTTVYLWIQSQVRGNAVVTVVTSPMTEVRFGGGVTSISLVYDAKQGIFVTAPNAKPLPAGAELVHHAPSTY